MAQQIVKNVTSRTVVKFPSGSNLTIAALENIIGTLPEYATNEAAQAAGKKLYRASAAHEGAYPGTVIYTEP